MADGQDSSLSITGSIVGIVALILSVSTIVQGAIAYFSAYRNAPLELRRYTSSISNTIDEKSFRLRGGHIPGQVRLDLGNGERNKGSWSEMLQEYFDAHLELADELDSIKQTDKRINSPFSPTRIFWLFTRKNLDETVRRIETLRLRKMAVALNALMTDMAAIKESLDNIESRIPAGPINLPPARAPDDRDDPAPPARPLKLYTRSVMGESVTDIVRTSLDSR